jgi:3-oxoacyl-[acyl-carrier protein] reductase
MEFSGKRILVTGGSSGIGKATAAALVSKGAKVAITGRNLAKLKSVAEEIGASAVSFDAADYTSIERGIEDTIDAIGGVDVLINNAGIGEFGILEDIEPEMFERVLSTNVIGVAMITKAVIPHFKNQGGGHILNIGSTAAAKGFAGGSVYVASKFALRGMTQCWQAELRKDDIRVMLINPSEVTTAFGSGERKEREEVDSKLRPKEIADAIVGALAMDDRGFIPELAVWATNPK